jgi:hypothetical protein
MKFRDHAGLRKITNQNPTISNDQSGGVVVIVTEVRASLRALFTIGLAKTFERRFPPEG